MPSRLLVNLGFYILDKRNFFKVGIGGFGGFTVAYLLWSFGPWGGLPWWLFLIALGLASGWAWSWFMWKFFQADIQRISSLIDARRRDEPS